jgi:hypothetical protein
MKISKDKTDKLFSDKLESHTKAPREQAWLKLEAKLHQKQKKIVPIWQRLGFAASIILLVFAGVLAYLYQPTNTLNIGQVAYNQKIKIVKPQLNLKSVDSDVASLTTSNSQDKPTEKTLNRSEENSPIFQTVAASSTLNSENRNQQLPNLEINQQEGLAHENVALLLESRTVENKEVEDKIASSEDLTVVVTLANFEEIENAPNQYQETDKKTKFVSRLFKQMINAKNGDKVEWNEIGLKPSKILARAESRLKSTSDGFNNTYQSTKNKTIL